MTKAIPAVANIIIINENENENDDNDLPITAAAGILASSKPRLRRSRGFFVHPLNLFRFALHAAAFAATAASAMSATNGSSSNNSSAGNPPVPPAAPAAAISTPSPPDDADAELARSTIDFLTVARGLKTTPRTGWIRQKAGPRIESVADHSWRMSLMAMVAASSANASSGRDNDDDDAVRYDANRCIKIALVHDLAEATVGDITPHCGVSDATKHDMELRAITGMTSRLVPGAASEAGAEILELWKEYEAGVTPEAKLVKDMDKLEMILQALEYETDGKNEESLDGFFDSTRGKWRTPIGRAWGEEINRRRPPENRAQPQPPAVP